MPTSSEKWSGNRAPLALAWPSKWYSRPPRESRGRTRRSHAAPGSPSGNDEDEDEDEDGGEDEDEEDEDEDDDKDDDGNDPHEDADEVERALFRM